MALFVNVSPEMVRVPVPDAPTPNPLPASLFHAPPVMVTKPVLPAPLPISITPDGPETDKVPPLTSRSPVPEAPT